MKILLTHASAGAGHTRAAQALHRGFQEHSNHQVTIIDVLDYTSPVFKRLYRKTYAHMVKYTPTVWAGAFAVLDWPFLQGAERGARRIYNHCNGRLLEKFLIDEKFDYVISTHFMPTEVVASLKRSGKINSKLITVVTDYDVHKIWLANGVDQYCVASDWTGRKIHQLGIPEESVVVTGIPIDERFTRPSDVRVLKDSLGLEREKFTVLIATGSFGFGPIEKIVDAISQDFQVAVICGHNQRLYSRIKSKALPHVRALARVDNMHEWMAVSDVMVTKPGGLSITEAMNSHLPMIFFSPIPGQETQNIRILGEYGIGKADLSVKQMTAELEKMRTSKDYYRTLLMRSSLLAHPQAVRDIIGLVV